MIQKSSGSGFGRNRCSLATMRVVLGNNYLIFLVSGAPPRTPSVEGDKSPSTLKFFNELSRGHNAGGGGQNANTFLLSLTCSEFKTETFKTDRHSKIEDRDLKLCEGINGHLGYLGHQFLLG